MKSNGEAPHEYSAHYENLRAEYAQLRLEEKAIFIFEAVFTTLAGVVETAAQHMTDFMGGVTEEAMAEEAAEEPKPKAAPKKTTRTKAKTTAKRKTKKKADS